MTIAEYLKKNYADEKLRIDGKETREECDPFAWHIWVGSMKNIPEALKGLEIVNDGLSLTTRTHVLEVLVEDKNSPLYMRSYTP